MSEFGLDIVGTLYSGWRGYKYSTVQFISSWTWSL